jgi:hypothetical protein
VTAFPSGPSKKEFYDHSILRTSPSQHPGLGISYAIIASVNGTPTKPDKIKVYKNFKGVTSTRIIGTASGVNLISDLRSFNEAISDPLSVSEDRWRNLEFSTIYQLNYITFITPLPVGIDSLGFGFLLRPFELKLWIGLSSSFLTTLIIVWVFNWNKNSIISIASSLSKPLLDQQLLPSELKAFKKSIPLLAGWFLTGLVLSSVYRSNIISFLIQPSYIQPPSDFKQLFESEDWNVSRGGGFVASSLENLNRDFLARGINRESLDRVVAFYHPMEV